MAKLRFEMGPCDDLGLASVNGRVVLTTPLNEEDSWEQTVQDGDYRVRCRLSNEGGWDWKMNFACFVNGEEYVRHSISGNSLGYNGMIAEAEKSFIVRIRNGVVQR
jgi:hypothetical protein